MRRILVSVLAMIAICCVAIAFAAPTTLLQRSKIPRRKVVSTCDNTIYVSSRPYGTNSTRLFTLDAYTSSVIKDIATTDQYGYDAIAFNHIDHHIYGISNGNASGDPVPHLVKINPIDGGITDLGSFPEFSGKEWIVGAIMQDGSYVIGDFGTSSWLRLDLTTRTIVDGGTIPLSLVTAWATNPKDNIIYGYQSYTKLLMSFNPYTHEFKSFEKPLDNVGVVPCSAAFLQDSTMFLYCKESLDSPTDNMFTVNLSEEKATLISSGPGLGAGNMATCAFAPGPTPTPTPTPTPSPTPTPTPPSTDWPGNWQHGDRCITIYDDLTTAKSYSKCGPFNCHRKEGAFSTTSDSNSAVIAYEGFPKTTQELELLSSKRMSVHESVSFGQKNRKNYQKTEIYHKVKRCRWKPHWPWPPHPHPKPPPPEPK